MAEGYELSEDAARRTAAAVRRVEAMKPDAGAAATRGRNVPYKPAFYRLATNEGDGEYTCRRQAWDDDAKAFADVAESHQAEYDVDVTAYDYQERADGVAGAAGTGQIVRGWKIHVGGATVKDGQWITLIDVADAMDKTFYAYLVTACGYWIAVNKNGHVLGTCYFVSGTGWEWDSPSEWGIPHPAVAPEPTWTPGTWL